LRGPSFVCIVEKRQKKKKTHFPEEIRLYPRKERGLNTWARERGHPESQDPITGGKGGEKKKKTSS